MYFVLALCTMIVSQSYYVNGKCNLSDVYKNFNDYYRIYNTIQRIFNEKFLIVMTDANMINKTIADYTSINKHKIAKLFIEEGFSLNTFDDLKFIINKIWI